MYTNRKIYLISDFYVIFSFQFRYESLQPCCHNIQNGLSTIILSKIITIRIIIIILCNKNICVNCQTLYIYI